tara:strand:- start:896 stop:1132 length:237 start_codon:yes stop_codon:yes gene_type:complete
MITVEFDHDETLITIMDREGKQEDVSALLYDDVCYIRQWNEEKQWFDLICLTPAMYLQLMKSFKLPEGAFIMDVIKTD